MPQPTRNDWLSIAALGLIWGGTFMVISIALRGYGPLTVACARTSLGAVSLIGLAMALRRPLPRIGPSLATHVATIGALSTALPFFLISWGQQFVPSAFAGLSMAAVPLFVLPLAHLFLPDERLTLRRAAGFSLGFTGAALLIGPAAVQGLDAGLPQLACLAAALCYAVSGILTRRCPPIDPIILAAATLVVGAVILIPAMLAVEGWPQPARGDAMLAIVALGLIPTALAALIRVSVIRSAGPSFMTLTNYQVPLWSVLFGVVFLGEDLPLRFFAALALILAGLAVAQRRQTAA